MKIQFVSHVSFQTTSQNLRRLCFLLIPAIQHFFTEMKTSKHKNHPTQPTKKPTVMPLATSGLGGPLTDGATLSTPSASSALTKPNKSSSPETKARYKNQKFLREWNAATAELRAAELSIEHIKLKYPELAEADGVGLVPGVDPVMQAHFADEIYPASVKVDQAKTEIRNLEKRNPKLAGILAGKPGSSKEVPLVIDPGEDHDGGGP